MMGSDSYQSLEELQADINRDYPRIGVGANCFIRRAIIDKNARIGAGVQILNESNQTEVNGDGFFIRDGIVIIPKNSVIPDGAII